MERKIGIVVYASQKGWWLIRVGPPQSLETYFMHRNFVRSGTMCDVGMEVEFDAGPQRTAKEKPQALNCDIKAGQ